MKADQRLSQSDSESAKDENQFIPNLCQINVVLMMLILTQLFALMVSVVQAEKALINWEFLGLISIFSHSIVLSCAAIICFLRNSFRQQKLSAMSLYCMVMILSITWLYSWLSSQLFPAEIIGDPTLFILRNLLISAVLGGLLLRYFYLQFQWREQRQAELRARLEALQARIRPHFLFNSMNTIASLISIDPHQAEEAVLDLSTLFRATLNNQTMLISLDEEIELCRHYLNIEALRLGDRLQVEWKLERQPHKVSVPPLTLQPLLENAIYHGIQPRTDGGTITIESYCKKGAIYILVSNPFEPGQDSHKGNQIALDNIRSRLATLFGQIAVLKTSQLNNIFTVTLRFPIQR